MQKAYENIMQKNGVVEGEDVADVLYATYEILLFTANELLCNEPYACSDAAKIREAAEEIIKIYFDFEENREFAKRKVVD